MACGVGDEEVGGVGGGGGVADLAVYEEEGEGEHKGEDPDHEGDARAEGHSHVRRRPVDGIGLLGGRDGEREEEEAGEGSSAGLGRHGELKGRFNSNLMLPWEHFMAKWCSIST